MPRSLPPLTALRAFDAAARHLSFARAAQELGVTPSALSYQIKTLEAHLGAPVFRRLNRAVVLTELGQTLARDVHGGFEALAEAWARARRATHGSVITVTAGPAFISKWLAPRLSDFATAHPDISLRITASLSLSDMDRDEVDVAIRFGQSGDPELYAREILRDWWTPMVAPRLAARLAQPADLCAMPLLHQTDTEFVSPSVTWADWFASVGIQAPEDSGTQFSQADHAIAAAIAGAGAILGRVSLAASDLEAGRLVMPFAQSLQRQAAYRMVCRPGDQAKPHIATFMDWMTQALAPVAALGAGRVFDAPPV